MMSRTSVRYSTLLVIATSLLLALVACATPATNEGDSDGFVINNFELAPDGSELLMHVWGDDLAESIARIDLDGEMTVRPITFDCRYAAGGAAYLPDGNTVAVLLTPFDKSLTVNGQWTPILRFIDNQTDEVTLDVPIVDGDLVVGLAVSDTGQEIYFVNRESFENFDLRRFDTGTQQFSTEFDGFAANDLSFFRFVGIEDGRIVFSAGKAIDNLTPEEITVLGFAEKLEATELDTPVIAYRTSDDPTQVSLSQAYSSLRGMFESSNDANRFWGSMIYLAAINLKAVDGIYYAAIDLPPKTEDYPQHGIYAISGDSVELVLDAGFEVDSFAISKDRLTVAAVYKAADESDQIAIFDKSPDGTWTRRSLPNALNRLPLTERCNS